MALIGIVLMVFGWFLLGQAMDLIKLGWKIIIKYLKG